MPLLWASLIALLVPGIVHYLSGWLTCTLLLVQWAEFHRAGLLFRIPKLLAADPAFGASLACIEPGASQFLEQNLHHTVGSTGVLIFVCEAERYVEILVDDGFPAGWITTVGSIVDAFTRQVKQGQTCQGSSPASRPVASCSRCMCR